MRGGSRVIRVNKADLIAKLEGNLSQHAELVTKAQEVYRLRVVQELDQRLADAKAGKPIDPGFLHRLPIPQDYSIEYRQALAELEWEVGDEVELSSEDFRRFVLNEWEWQNQFVASNSMYLS